MPLGFVVLILVVQLTRKWTSNKKKKNRLLWRIKSKDLINIFLKKQTKDKVIMWHSNIRPVNIIAIVWILDLFLLPPPNPEVTNFAEPEILPFLWIKFLFIF